MRFANKDAPARETRQSNPAACALGRVLGLFGDDHAAYLSRVRRWI